MNLYHCMIDLKEEAKALAFAAAVQNWMEHLVRQDIICAWRLLRRKFGLASSAHCDFILEIEVESMAQLDAAFATLREMDDAHDRHYDLLHQMIGRAEIGLYRPYPDAEHRERVALI